MEKLVSCVHKRLNEEFKEVYPTPQQGDDDDNNNLETQDQTPKK